MNVVFVSHPADRLEQYFGPRAVRALHAIAEVRYNANARELGTQELVDAARDCDAIIAYRQTPAPRALFAGLPKLAAFLRCAVDIRTVDIAAASEFGVLVTQASAGYVAAVTEWIVAMMVDLARGIAGYTRDYRQGSAPTPVMGRQLRGATLGVIGHGQIGSDLVRVALALGMDVLVNDPQPVPAQPGLQQVDLGTLLSGSDFVVCLAPANTDTDRLMNAEAFAAMKPQAFFINASRGELVDDAALLHALDRGQLAGCAVDVGRAPDQMPSPAVARHPRVLATPHIGGLTLPAIEHQALETVMQFSALKNGQLPPGAVNADRATRWQHWHEAVK
ncbi:MULTISPECIES: NAD(P)-dependent oxidoreductase [Ramlibacter]|uniref:Hydroxyacid dehydrogenase n=1 Tax=Ramlibacter pinisoli TaxID=2682844 RepID=A0A6N8IYF0_9BURK|nr:MULTISPECIES: NAD(P)-dependent oxidoreductase [Ramlibacter]MBA2962061.1 hydroxyacid dehydrogenase [Ramlibacter sp. CGMCC 1.13660]MVQ32004.1 hydroxyacid dehydrogenase [Ramlibacter pinisoli]